MLYKTLCRIYYPTRGLFIQMYFAFSVNTIPTKITAWITYNIIADIHNFTLTNSDFSGRLPAHRLYYITSPTKSKVRSQFSEKSKTAPFQTEQGGCFYIAINFAD